VNPAASAIPHVRLGVAWAVAFAIAAALSPWTLALLLGATAALAGLEIARSRGPDRFPPIALAAAAATLVITSAAGVLVMLGAALVVAGVVLAAPLGPARRLPMLGIACVLGVAGSAPVLTRAAWGALAALVLVGLVCCYDAAAYLVGTGANGAWEGRAAGAVATVPLVLLTAAVLVPPFRGVSPWVLGAAVAGLAPVGGLVATRLLGSADRRAPGLGRLDTLLVAGPVWLALAAVLHVG
jgi:hypothetical protein